MEDGLLFEGSCDEVERLALIGHAIINVSGTLLLAASNYAMQILIAPSREDVDLAHCQKTWFFIGSQSFKNLRSISRYRATLWAFLGLASLPLHLIYNSVIFSLTNSSEYMIAVVSSEFEHGGPFSLSMVNNMTSSSSDPRYTTGKMAYNKSLPEESLQDWIPTISQNDHVPLKALQKKAVDKQLVEMTTGECIKAYNNVPSQVTYHNLIAVSDNARSDSSVVWINYFLQNDSVTDWACKYNYLLRYGRQTDCDPERVVDPLSTWSIGLYATEDASGRVYVGSHPISRCLAEKIERPCSLKYDGPLLVTVIVANTVKVLAMIATLLQYRRPGLVTIGDALASFLERPDTTTVGMCLATAKGNTHSELWDRQSRLYLRDKKGVKRSSGASRAQWTAAYTLAFLNTVAAIVLLAICYDQSNILDWSFSSDVKLSTLNVGQGLGISAIIVVANIPQLFLSFYYLTFNRLVTCMAIDSEWSRFAYQRKGLRTSAPKMAQRSTYWLQLPLRFSLPMMATSAGLHYLASQSFYFGFIQSRPYHDMDGTSTTTLRGLGYSQSAAQFLSWALFLSMSAALLWGSRYNRPGLPPGGSNSAILSAACHPPTKEEDVHLKPVQWGEVQWEEGADGIGHCSLSSEEVSMPTQGNEYW